MAKLLGSIAYDPATRVSLGTADVAMTAFDTTNARITFNAPASGKVFWRVRVGAALTATTSSGYWAGFLGILEGSTIRARASVYSRYEAASYPAGTPAERIEACGVISGLTGGNQYTFDAAYGTEKTLSVAPSWGGPNTATANDSSGALIFEIWEVTT